MANDEKVTAREWAEKASARLEQYFDAGEDIPENAALVAIALALTEPKPCKPECVCDGCESRRSEELAEATGQRVLVKLRIPADAKRSNASGRKCRSEYAEVLAIETMAGEPFDGDVWSLHDHRFNYQVGATVKPTEPFCEDRWQECAPGIHWYITREEAEAQQ